MTPAEIASLKALAWHALFGFPLTVEEVRLAAPMALGLDEVAAALESLAAAGQVGERHGLFFLAGHAGDVETRLARYDLAERKFRRARRFAAVARFLPFVRGVFVCNTLARSGAQASSDIDLLVVASDRHVWTARLFVTGLAALLRIRPTPRDATDGLCLSFYAAESALDFKPLALPGDEYLPRWVADLYPLYDEASVADPPSLKLWGTGATEGKGLAESLHEANRWILTTVPNALAPRTLPRRSLRPCCSALKRFGEVLVAWLEPLARSIQLLILPAKLKAGGSGVVVTDRLLKFHDHDRRAELTRRYHESLLSLGLES